MDEITPQNNVQPEQGPAPYPVQGLAPEMPQAPLMPSAPQADMLAPAADEGSHASKKYLLMGGIGVLALVIAVSGYFVFSGGDGKEAADDATDETLVVAEETPAADETVATDEAVADEALITDEAPAETAEIDSEAIDEATAGEDALAATSYCGDGLCDNGETPFSCPTDCQTPSASPEDSESSEELLAVVDGPSTTEEAAAPESGTEPAEPAEPAEPVDETTSEFEDYVASLQEATTTETDELAEVVTETAAESATETPAFECPEGTVYEAVLDACILASDVADDETPAADETTAAETPAENVSEEVVATEPLEEVTPEEPASEPAAETATAKTVTESVSKTAAADAAALHGAYIQGDTGPAPIAYLAIYAAAQGLFALRRRLRK